MGELIVIAEYRARRLPFGCAQQSRDFAEPFAGCRQPAAPSRTSARATADRQASVASRALGVTFYFDLRSPFTYLAAERVDRALPGIRWQPARAEGLNGRGIADHHVRAQAERRARELRLPLVWPDDLDADARGAMRTAAWAGEQGRGAAYALAALRLAWCGSFSLDDPELIAEAAGAAGLSAEAALEAAGQPERDGLMEAAGRALLERGAHWTPVLEVAGRLFSGERAMADGLALAVSGRVRLEDVG